MGLNQIKMLVASNDYGADLLCKTKLLWMLHFFENGSFGLLERFSCSTSWAARHCKMQGSVRWNRDSEERHLRLPSHGAAKGKGIGRPPSIAKPLGRPLRTNRASVSWALNEASFPSRGAPRHRFVFEGVM